MTEHSSSQTSAAVAQHAVVIGAGMAGLLAARVLADHVDRVTVLERDDLPDDSSARVGAPQGKHIHVLWAGGAQVIEKWFPGILDELVQDGAVAMDACNDLKWFHHGVWKKRMPSPITMHAQTRPFLEQRVRRRLVAHPRVEFLKASAMGLCLDETSHQVVGVQVQRRDDDNQTESIAANFVVDASGRGSKMPSWLEAVGDQRPAESTVEIDLVYSSRTYLKTNDPSRDWKLLAVFAKAPQSKRYGVVAPIEGNRWIVTLAGCLADHPPADEAGFMDYAKNLDQPDLHAAIEHAQADSPISTYRFPHQLRRHYERLKRLPSGLVVMGDAMCSFNPLYGQGMTVCAQQAVLLDQLLCSGSYTQANGFGGLSSRYFRGGKKIVDNPWLLASCTDFLYPETGGGRAIGTKWLGSYLTHLLELSATNATIVTRFYEVIHFLKPPTVLFHPYVLLQVLKHAFAKERKDRSGI